MRVLALLSGGIHSAAAASILKKRNHIVVGYHFQSDPNARIIALSDALGILCETEHMVQVPHTCRVPVLVFHAALVAHSDGYDAISVGLHYSNIQPYSSTASVIYMRRLLESAMPRDSNIRLLTPVYDYTKETIQAEAQSFGFIDFTQQS